MPLARHASAIVLATALPALAACEAGASLEKALENVMATVVPDQHREFSREYAEHVLAGEFAAAEAMVETGAWCTRELRGVKVGREKPAQDETRCYTDSAMLAPALAVVPRGAPLEVHVVNYHARSASPNALDVTIEQEFVYDSAVFRVAMDYRRNGDARHVTKTVITLDDTPLFTRIGKMLDAMPFNFFWWLTGLQFAAYLAVPLIVWRIVRGQRRRDAERRDEGRLSA